MQHPLVQLMEKPARLVIGLMSGTSADGVDAALCRITGHGTSTKVEQLGFVFDPFDACVRDEILRLAGGKEATAADFCRINFLLGRLYTETSLRLCRECGIKPEDIDLIGSHGQTLWHISQPEAYLGQTFRSTLQLGECSVLTETFGCPVVGDFRVRDVAAGGLGAPLVPYSEYLIYRSETKCIALQNIGGIGNITCLPPACKPEEVFAFDTGPGNMVMDAVYSLITHGEKRFDEGGAFAAKGQVNQALLKLMMEDEYVRRQPPKTTGREYYGPAYVQRIMSEANARHLTDEDLMATVTAFTAATIAYSIEHFFPVKPEELIIGGGGSMNATLLKDIAAALPACKVMTNEELGYDSNAKEAVAFAVLANEAIFAGCNNMPSVTGAAKGVVMGKISL